MAKKVNMNAATCSKEKKKENFRIMVSIGEPLGLELIDKLSQLGCSPEALMAETYAVAKAYGSLRAMSLNEGWECQDLFEKLVPMFTEQTQEMLAELEKEEGEK